MHWTRLIARPLEQQGSSITWMPSCLLAVTGELRQCEAPRFNVPLVFRFWD